MMKTRKYHTRISDRKLPERTAMGVIALSFSLMMVAVRIAAPDWEVGPLLFAVFTGLLFCSFLIGAIVEAALEAFFHPATARRTPRFRNRVVSGGN